MLKEAYVANTEDSETSRSFVVELFSLMNTNEQEACLLIFVLVRKFYLINSCKLNWI